MMDIQSIREKVRTGKYRISFTHTEKLRERKIEMKEIEVAIATGEIIEAYHDDPRGQSCLIFGLPLKVDPCTLSVAILRTK